MSFDQAAGNCSDMFILFLTFVLILFTTNGQLTCDSSLSHQMNHPHRGFSIFLQIAALKNLWQTHCTVENGFGDYAAIAFQISV